MSEYICKFCDRITNSKTSNIAHECRCKLNPDRKPNTKKWLDAMSNRKATNGYIKARERGEILKPSLETIEKLRLSAKRRTHSEKTKKKISNIRKAYLRANPHMVPYVLNHYSKGESYPEIYFRKVFENNNVTFKQELRVDLYSLDFAFLDKKIDVEIDGEQHYLDLRIIESDKRRTIYLESLGWIVYRVRWADYQRLHENDKKIFCQNLVKRLT